VESGSKPDRPKAQANDCGGAFASKAATADNCEIVLLNVETYPQLRTSNHIGTIFLQPHLLFSMLFVLAQSQSEFVSVFVIWGGGA